MQRAQLNRRVEIRPGSLPDAGFIEPAARAHVPRVEPGTEAAILRARLLVGRRIGAHGVPWILVVGLGTVPTRVIEAIAMAHFLADHARPQPRLAVEDGRHAAENAEVIHRTV